MPDPLTIAAIVGTGIGTGLAGFIGGKRGSKTGAENTLNGTAAAVRRIETKLDTHTRDTTQRFDGISEDLQDARERVSRIEGQLDAGFERRRNPRT